VKGGESRGSKDRFPVTPLVTGVSARRKDESLLLPWAKGGNHRIFLSLEHGDQLIGADHLRQDGITRHA
jgi:hypothetical protein